MYSTFPFDKIVVLWYSFIFLADQNGMMGSMMQDLAFAIPGVDEAMSFAEIMKYVSLSMSFCQLTLSLPTDTSNRWNFL